MHRRTEAAFSHSVRPFGNMHRPRQALPGAQSRLFFRDPGNFNSAVGSQIATRGIAARRNRKCRIHINASTAAISADPGPKERKSSLLEGPARAWERFWSLGQPTKSEAHKPKNLGAIASKLWAIMNVNMLLLTGALICMVSFSASKATVHAKSLVPESHHAHAVLISGHIWLCDSACTLLSIIMPTGGMHVA
jgi:hypothetical protein